MPLCAHILKTDRTPHKRQNLACCLKESVTFRCCLQTKCVRNQIKFDVCPQYRRKMVRTKHCCWGKCKTDSRYRKKWPKSLKKSRNKPSRYWEVQKVNCSVFAAVLHESEYNQKHIHMCPPLAWRKGSAEGKVLVQRKRAACRWKGKRLYQGRSH